MNTCQQNALENENKNLLSYEKGRFELDKKKALATAIIAAFFFSSLAGIQLVKLAEANFMPMQIPQPAFIIKSDGSVYPSTAPILRDGNVYTFTDDIVGFTIASEVDNVVIDGGGYSLTGNGTSSGIFILNRNGITVRNMNISNFSYGIRLIAENYMGMTSSDNSLLDNTVTDNEYGIYLSYSSNNMLRNNIMISNPYNFAVQGEYEQDVDASNRVDGKPIIYWVNQQDRTVPSEAGYVALVNCLGITVQDLNLSNNGQGVVLFSTTNSTITKNNITNTGDAIYIEECSSNTISVNKLANNSNGLRGQASSDNIISLNNITYNENGIYFTKVSTGNIISGNHINSNSVDSVHLWGSTNTDIEANTIGNNTESGISFFESGRNRIVGNSITENGNGIKFWFHTNDNNVSDNHIAENVIGILVDDAYDNNIIGNMITKNIDFGIQLKGSQNNNVICHNSFVDNNIDGDGLQVSLPAYMGMGSPIEWLPGHGNVWDNGTAGNYWSDYLTRYPNATELEGTRIGDTQFYINENNFDRYPLMEPNSIPEFSSLTAILLTLATFTVVLAICKQKLRKSKR
jgi:parallel beta-helix repeat protein